MNTKCKTILHLRILPLWMKGPLKCRIGAATIADISTALISLRGFIPKEFVQKPRSLQEVGRWKATGLRQMLLFTGPLVPKGKISNSRYKNLLLLLVGISS